MKKPWWVRLAGWLFWLGLGWIALVFWGAGHVPGGGILLVGLGLYGAFAIGCLVVWMAGSLVAWAVVKHGRQQAAILRDLFKEHERKAAVENVPPSPAGGAPGKHSSLTCQVCKTRSAALFCTAHGVPICMPDLDTHDTPHCVYVPAARVQVVGAGPPPSQRRAAPSVLGLGNA